MNKTLRPIKSSDDRKPRIVARLKAAMEVSKVTNVRASDDGEILQASCLRKEPGARGFNNIGVWQLNTLTGETKKIG